MGGLLTRSHLLTGALIITLMSGGVSAQSEDVLLMVNEDKDLSHEPEPIVQTKEHRFLFDSVGDKAEIPQDVLEGYEVLAKENPEPTPSSAEYWRDINVAFDSPTAVSEISNHCGMLITPAPILIARQDDAGELAALSNSAAAASRSASAGIQNAEISASNAIASVSRTASQSISSFSSSAASVSFSASSALSSMSSRLSSAQSSASSAVLAAESSASSAIMAASVLVQAASGSVDAAGSSFFAAAAKATDNAQNSISAIGAAATQLISQSQAQAKASQALAISSTNAAIAIVISIVGSAILTFVIFFFIIQYRKKRLANREKSKYVDDYRSRSRRDSYRDSKSSIRNLRNHYKDEKQLVSMGNRKRSRSQSRHRPERERGKKEMEREIERGRRDGRGSAVHGERPSRYDKESSNSRTRVGSTPLSAVQSFSDYSPFPRDDYSPKILTGLEAGASETHPTPKTSQSPQKDPYNVTPTLKIKEPEKVAKKPEYLNVFKARKDLVSISPTASSTSNNLSAWITDQTQRTSVYGPSLGKRELSQPFNRGGIERPRIQIPASVAGEIVEVDGLGDRYSAGAIRESQFQEGAINYRKSEVAEIENGKMDTISWSSISTSASKLAMNSNPNNNAATKPNIVAHKILEDLDFRSSNFPFPKSDKPFLRGPGGGAGLPENPKMGVQRQGLGLGLPGNSKGVRRDRESTATDRSLEFESFEGRARREEMRVVAPGEPRSVDEGWIRESLVGKAR